MRLAQLVPQLKRALFRVVVYEVRYVRANQELVTRINIPMEQNPDVELDLCQGGFCLLEE